MNYLKINDADVFTILKLKRRGGRFLTIAFRFYNLPKKVLTTQLNYYYSMILVTTNLTFIKLKRNTAGNQIYASFIVISKIPSEEQVPQVVTAIICA